MTTWTATIWADDIQPVSHRELGLARLLWQYRGSQPRLQGLLGAFLDGLQSLEDLAFEVLAGRWPLTAIGAQLDTLGKIVAQPRGDLLDDPYRLMILGRIFVNLHDGRVEDFIELLSIIGVTDPVAIYEWHPAGLEISATGLDYQDVTGDLVFAMKGGGVRLHFVSSTYDEDELFTTSDTLGSDQLDSSRGLRSLPGVTPVTGGRFPDLRTS